MDDQPEFPVVLDALVDDVRTPTWGTFVACHLFWPLVGQLIVTASLVPLRNIFIRLKESSYLVHRLVNGYTGDMVEKQRIEHPWFLEACNALQSFISLASVFMYAHRTYHPNASLDDDQLKWDLAFATIFSLLYIVDLLHMQFRVRGAWRVGTLVDMITILPMLLPVDIDLHPVPVEQRWLSLAYLRVCRALYSFYEIGNLFGSFQSPSELASRAILAVLRTLTLMVCMSGTIFALEVLGELPGLAPTKIATDMGDLSFVMMTYWICTTISTVGYGDYSPTTIPSQLVIIAFIFVGGNFFLIETAEIANLKWSLEEGRGKYTTQKSSDQHILVIGTGVAKFSSVLETFIHTMMDSCSNKEDMPNLIFLSEAEYDSSLVDFVAKRVHSNARRRIYLFRGSPSEPGNLDRVQASKCTLAFVLPALYSASIFDEDKANIVTALELQRVCPYVRVRLMLLAESSRGVAVTLGIPRERCFSMYGLKASVFAISSRVKGFAPMLAGLLEAGDWDANSFIAEQEPSTFNAYHRSLRNDTQGFLVGQSFDQIPWGSAVVKAYEESRGKVLLVGAQIDGKVQLNPDIQLEVGQVVLAISESPMLLDMFRDVTEHDWRKVFVERRSEMLREHKIDARFLHSDKNEISVTMHAATERIKLSGSDAEGEQGTDLRSHFVSGASFKASAGAKEFAATFDDLKRMPCLVLIIVVATCEGTWDQIRKFINSLRSSYVPKTQPFVLVSPSKAPDELLNLWADDTCAFLVGNIVDSLMLEFAGASVAEHVAVFRGVRSGGREKSNMFEGGVGIDDYKVLTLGLMLWTIRPVNSRFEVFELGGSQAAFAMEQQIDGLLNALDGKSHSFSALRSQHAHITTHSLWEQLHKFMKRRRHFAATANRELLMLKCFAAGCTFTPDFFGGLLGTVYSFPMIVELTEAFCCPEDHAQTSFVWQVLCPKEWVGKAYKDLVLWCAKGAAGDGSCLGSEPAIVLAIYRDGKSEVDSGTAFNITLPDADMSMQESDLITVLASKRFGANAAEESILRGCPTDKQQFHMQREVRL